jgi:exodeoxyribonuclease VII large subunit
MARILQSQWDFDDVPDPEPQKPVEKIWTVGEITRRLKKWLEQEVGRVSIVGEISNLRRQSSGHIYFTLKDDQAALQCVLFRGTADANRSCLKDGAEIRAKGDFSIYAPRGQYQLVVREVEPQGAGALQAKFDALKLRLQGLGWFESERKRPIPKFPQRIGCVTSASGAALRDFVHVIERRFPGLQIWVYSSRVQGAGAAEEIARGIDAFQSFQDENGNRADVIVLTRGGGSLEDLWAFNEEIVAQHIFQSSIPVISAVGHEIDFSISDFVADLRAATPSAAAEILTQHYLQAIEKADALNGRLSRASRQYIQWALHQQQTLLRRLELSSPKRWLDTQRQKLDDLDNDLSREAQRVLQSKINQSREIQSRLQRIHPERIAAQLSEALQSKWNELQLGVNRRLETQKTTLKSLQERLKLLSPWNTLDRGYSITFDSNTGQVVRDINKIKKGDALTTHLPQGKIMSRVEEIKSEGR